MNLRLDRGEISLPKDFKFDIQSNHPFFSNEGTASVPATIPPSQQNRLLLGNPENQHAAHRFTKKLPAQLSHGIYSKRCQIIIDSASEKSGIATSLALQESEMYAELQDKKLQDIFQTTRVHTHYGGMYDYAESWAQGVNGDYVIFPVAADIEDANNADATGSKKIAKTIFNDNTDGKSLNVGGGTTTIEDETISTPPGYGIVPFMKLHVMLRKMFEYSDYVVDENVFYTDPVLSQIVVLHNTIDMMSNAFAAPNGQARIKITLIRESMMVPTVTVGEMLEWIRNKFGAFVTVESRHVSIRLMRDILQEAADMDLSAYMEEEFTVRHPEPRMIRCSCQHELESSEPAADTIEDLQARYSSIVNCTDVGQINGTGLFYVRPLGKFYYRQTANSTLTTSMVGTDGFDYYRRTDIETEEISSDDIFVPMVLKNGEYMPFIGDSIRRIMNSKDKETDAEQAIMICYVRYDGSKNYGTLYPFTPDGTEQPALSFCPDLTPEKLSRHFLSEYRDILLNGAPTISCKLDIPLHILINMDPWTPKLLNHSRVLIKSLKYSISESGITSCEAELQLLSSFADAREVFDPTFSSNLAWRRKDNRPSYSYPYGDGGKYSEWVEVLETDGLSDYTNSDRPSETPLYPNLIAKKRRRWVKIKHHWGYYKWFLDNGWSETTSYVYYDEYFESYNQE